jgi:hypothetical protein
MSSSTAAADFTNVANWQGVTNDVKYGSKDLVESGGVYDEVAPLRAQIKNIFYTLFAESKYLNYNGDLADNIHTNVYNIDVSEYGGKYLLIFHSNDDIYSLSCTTIYDSNNNIIERAKQININENNSCLVVFLPINASYARFTATRPESYLYDNKEPLCAISDNYDDYVHINFGYLNGETLEPNGGWFTTDFIPVKEGDEILCSLIAYQYAIRCYDQLKHFIQPKSIVAESDNQLHEYSTVISGGVRYVRICTFKHASVSIDIMRNNSYEAFVDNRFKRVYAKEEEYSIESIHKPFDFNGKTIVAFGDSIIAGWVSNPHSGGSYQDQTKSFINQFASMVNANIMNHGSGGTPITADGTKYTDKSVEFCTCLRCPAVLEFLDHNHEDYDIIFIAGGTNDLALQMNIGSWNDTNYNTLYGAMNYLCNELKTSGLTKL